MTPPMPPPLSKLRVAPTMRILRVQSETTQALATVFRSRQLPIRQRTQTMNAIRGMVAEIGITAGLGVRQVNRLRARLTDAESPLPGPVLTSMDTLFTHLDQLNEHIERLTDKIKSHVEEDANAKKLTMVPGVGPITVFAIQAFAGDLKGFRNGREFAAWLGLTPKEHSTGGKHRLGAITKMGQRDIRSLLVNGGMLVIKTVDYGAAPPHSAWLTRMLIEIPRMVVAVAVANRMARVLWHLTVHETEYDPTMCPI